MERLRIAILADGCPPGAIPEAHAQRVGTPMSDLQSLPALGPELVLLGFQDFAQAMRDVAWIKCRLPAVSIVIMGPPQLPETLVTAMQAGVAEVLPEPSAEAIRAAVMRVWFQLRSPRDRQVPREGALIVVHGSKGGAGKSCLALNLAAVLGKRSERGVALADLSLQAGDLDLMLDLRPQGSWTDLIQAGAPMAEAVTAVLARGPGGIHLLAAPSRPEDAELVEASTVDRVLRELRRQFPFVVVDTASALSEVTLRALDLADRVLVPVPMSLPALRQLQRSLRLWEELGVPPERLALIAVAGSGRMEEDAFRRVLGRSPAATLPYVPRPMERSLEEGEPLALLEPRSGYARAIAAIADGLGDDSHARTREPWWQAWRRPRHVLAQ